MESYHNETITEIKDYLTQISSLMDYIKLIYCPSRKGIAKGKCNCWYSNIAKTAFKKVFYLPPRADRSL